MTPDLLDCFKLFESAIEFTHEILRAQDHIAVYAFRRAYARNESIDTVFTVLWIGSCSLAYPGCQMPLEPAQKSDDALVTFERSGGFAGVYDKFTIYRGGSISSSEGITVRVPAARLNSILDRVAVLDLPTSCLIKIPHTLCSDCIQYHITIRNGFRRVVLKMDEPQMGGRDTLSKTAREIRDLVFAQKWK